MGMPSIQNRKGIRTAEFSILMKTLPQRISRADTKRKLRNVSRWLKSKGNLLESEEKEKLEARLKELNELLQCPTVPLKPMKKKFLDFKKKQHEKIRFFEKQKLLRKIKTTRQKLATIVTFLRSDSCAKNGKASSQSVDECNDNDGTFFSEDEDNFFAEGQNADLSSSDSDGDSDHDNRPNSYKAATSKIKSNAKLVTNRSEQELIFLRQLKSKSVNDIKSLELSLRLTLQQCLDNLVYVNNFPKNMPYISLFSKIDDKNVDQNRLEKSEKKKEKIRKQINQRLKSREELNILNNKEEKFENDFFITEPLVDKNPRTLRGEEFSVQKSKKKSNNSLNDLILNQTGVVVPTENQTKQKLQHIFFDDD